jgi:membrane-associated phospholipid phosphatase
MMFRLLCIFVKEFKEYAGENDKKQSSGQSDYFSIGVMLLLLHTMHMTAQTYELKKGVDISMGSGVIVLGTGAYLAGKSDKKFTEEQIRGLSTESVLSFDRSATGRWSPALARVSDAGLLLCVMSPAALMFSSGVAGEVSTIGIMGTENLLGTMVVTAFVKNTVRRTRPYVYNPDVDMSFKMQKDAKRSFFSGHTSLAFCSAVFTSTVFSKYHPQSDLKPWVWASSLTLASATGFLRYASGKHFPSDILAGAIVGSAIGYAIPRLHEVKQTQDGEGRVFMVRLLFPL